MKNNIIQVLMDRWLEGTSTPEEKEQLQQYFIRYNLEEEQVPLDTHYYPDQKRSQVMYARITRRLTLHHSPAQVHPINRRWMVSIAAVIIPLIIIASVVYFSMQDGLTTTLSTASVKEIGNKGKNIRYVRLPDGSGVWLNKNASIQVDTVLYAMRRNVVLQGEAYFEVAQHAGHPFTVTSGKLETKVLGTSFTIKMDTVITVSLFTGKVSLSAGGSSSQLLIPGQAAVYNPGSGQLRTAPLSIYARSWKTKEIVGKNERLEDVINYLRDYYEMPISINKDIAGKQFSGTLSLQGDLSKVLDRLLFVHQLKYKKNGNNSISIY